MAARKTNNEPPTYLVNTDRTGYKSCVTCGKRASKFDKCSGCREKEKKQLKKEEPKLEERHR